jgi:hypothetical protein
MKNRGGIIEPGRIFVSYVDMRDGMADLLRSREVDR